MYGVIVNAQKDGTTLEAIMQHGDDELPDFQDFLTLWISYLGDKTGREADRLILEAVGLLNDVSLAEKYAEQGSFEDSRVYWRGKEASRS